MFLKIFRLAALAILLAAVPQDAWAAGGKVIKVLPHYLDLDGRHTLAPSLFERDAYQFLLRQDRALQSTMRFDVQWRGRSAGRERLTLRLEVRGSLAHTLEPFILEESVKPARWFSRWSAIELPKDEYERLGVVAAWRVTLLDGDLPLGEQASFLW